ncbi:MAG: hypothetical protein ACK4ML_00765 [Alishewanella aestuarii]
MTRSLSDKIANVILYDADTTADGRRDARTDAYERGTFSGEIATKIAQDIIGSVGPTESRDTHGRTINTFLDKQGNPVSETLAKHGLAVSGTPAGRSITRHVAQHGPIATGNPEHDELAQIAFDQRMHQDPVERFSRGAVLGDKASEARRRGQTMTSRAFERGQENLKGSFLTFARVAADAAGWDEKSEQLAQEALFHMERAQLIPAEMASLQDVKNAGWTPKALATFAYEKLIEEVPSLAVDGALTLTGAGAGGVIARRGALAAANKIGPNTPDMLRDAALTAQKKGAKAGAAAGFAASTYPQSVAQVQQELDAHGVEDANPLIALTGGAVVAGVQMAPEVILAARMLKQAGGDTAAKTFGEVMKNIVKGTAIGVAAEGSAEALATTISKEIAKAHPDANYSNWTEDDFWQLLDATAAGATVGGTLGGASSALGDVGGWANDRIKSNYEARQQQQQPILDESATPLAAKDQISSVPEIDQFIQKSAAQQRPEESPYTEQVDKSPAEIIAADILAQTQQPAAEQPTTEQLPAEQPASEQITTEQLTSEQLPAEQPASEQITTEQLTSEQLPAEQPASEQITTEQLTSEQLPAEQPASEQPAVEQTVAQQIASAFLEPVGIDQGNRTELQDSSTGNPRRQFGIGQIDGDTNYRESGLSAYRQLREHIEKAGVKFDFSQEINPFSPEFSDTLERMARVAKTTPFNAKRAGKTGVRMGTLTRDEIDRLMNKAAIIPLRQHPHGQKIDRTAAGEDVSDLLAVMAKNVHKLGESQRDVRVRQTLDAFLNQLGVDLPADPVKALSRLKAKMIRGFRFTDPQLAAIDSIANAMYIPTADYKPRTDAGRMQSAAKRSAPVNTQGVIDNQNKRTLEKPLPPPDKSSKERKASGYVERKRRRTNKVAQNVPTLFSQDNANVIAELAEIMLPIRRKEDGKVTLTQDSLVIDILSALDSYDEPTSDELFTVANITDKDTGEADPEAAIGTIIDTNNPDDESASDIANIGRYQDMQLSGRKRKKDRAKLLQQVKRKLFTNSISADAQAFADDYLKAIGWKASRIANMDTADKIATVIGRMAQDYDQFVAQPQENRDRIDLDIAAHVAFDLIKWYADNIIPREVDFAVTRQGKPGPELLPFARAVKEYLLSPLAQRGVDVNDSEFFNNIETFAQFGVLQLPKDQDGNEFAPTAETSTLSFSALSNGSKLNYRQRKAISNYVLPSITQINATPEIIQLVEASDYRGLLDLMVVNNIIPFNNTFGVFMRQVMDYNLVNQAPAVLQFIRGEQSWGLTPDLPTARKGSGPVKQTVYRENDPATGQTKALDKPKLPLGDVGTDANRLPKQKFNNIPVDESIPVQFNITSPTQEDGSNTTAVRSRFHILGFVMDKLSEVGVAREDLPTTIRDIVINGLNDLVNIDPRLLAASIDLSPNIPDSTIVYREQVEKGEPLEYTWGEVRRLAAEAENKASSLVSSVLGQHRYATQNEKVLHLRQLEQYMNALAGKLLTPDFKGLSDLGIKLARSLVNLNPERYAESEANVKRLIGQMYLATYGRDNAHLDPLDSEVDQTEQNLRNLRGAESLLHFTADDMDVTPGLEAFVKQVNAEREALQKERSDAKKTGADVDDYSISSDFVNLKQLEKVLNWLNNNTESPPSVTGDPLTVDNFKKHFNGLTDARTRLAEMDNDRSSASRESKFDDLMRLDGIDRDDVLGERAQDISWQSAEVQRIKTGAARVKELDKYGLSSGTNEVSNTYATLTAAMRKFASDLKILGDGATPEAVISSAGSALLRAFRFERTAKLNITFDPDREVSISNRFVDGINNIQVNLTQIDQSNPKESLARAITELSHELAHLVAHVDRLNDTELKKLNADFEDFAKNNQIARNYTIDEYLADRVAAALMRNIRTAVNAAQHSGGIVSRIVAAITDGLAAAFSMVKQIFPGRNFSPMKPYSDIENIAMRLLGLPAHLTDMRYFDGAPRNNLAKVKEIAPKILDNSMANFFKPVARRLQNIDRTLARMFYTPPGAKSAGQTAGLMDEAIHRRKEFVGHINRLYPDHKKFAADYEQFLSTGKASPRLTAAFKTMSDSLKAVNGTFEFKGVPVMFLNEDVIARKTELRNILIALDSNTTWGEVVDEFIASFDDRAIGYSSTDIRPGNPLNGAKFFDRLRTEHPEIIPTLRNAGFIREGSAAVLNYFVGGVATRIEFERLFGAMDKQDGKEFWNPAKKLSQRLDAIQDPRKKAEAIRTIHSMLGFDAMKVRPAWRIFNDWAVTLTSWAVLPFSGFASIPDLVMPFLRNRTWAGAFKGMARVTTMMATNPKRVKEITRAYSLASSAIHDTIWSQMASSNAFINKTPGALSTALFKFNGLELITKTSRNVAAVLAIDTIIDNASRNTEESKRVLSEIGLTRDQALAIKQYIDMNDSVPVFDPNGSSEHNALAEAASRAVTMFTNESVIHPNRGQLPAVMNDPRYRIFTLLKPFLFGFGAVIYGGNYREMRSRFMAHKDLGDVILNSPMIVSPLILAFALMMPMAALGLELREMLRDMLAGDDTYSQRLRNMSDRDYLERLFSRAGGAGYMEVPMMVMDGWDWGGSYGEKFWNAGVRAIGPVAGVADQIRKDIQNENRTLPRFGVWDPNDLVK